jgi:hypothetical protein
MPSRARYLRVCLRELLEGLQCSWEAIFMDAGREQDACGDSLTSIYSAEHIRPKGCAADIYFCNFSLKRYISVLKKYF